MSPSESSLLCLKIRTDNILCDPQRVGCLLDTCYGSPVQPSFNPKHVTVTLFGKLLEFSRFVWKKCSPAEWILGLLQEKNQMQSDTEQLGRSESSQLNSAGEAQLLQRQSSPKQRQTSHFMGKGLNIHAFSGKCFEYSCFFLESGETFRACLLICTGIKWALLVQ